MTERDAFYYQIDKIQEREGDLTHAVHTTRHWLQNYHENMNEAKVLMFHLKVNLVKVYDGYLYCNNEILCGQANVLAPFLPKALSRIYSISK